MGGFLVALTSFLTTYATSKKQALQRLGCVSLLIHMYFRPFIGGFKPFFSMSSPYFSDVFRLVIFCLQILPWDKSAFHQ